ncbi:hypothetical protein KP509_09G011000 [Ceratopteris richardii]|uniref:Uncharacterized protein n=1 Tax=Ceratopteris richardii TaxID=49495 RepID=A0A8T2TY34_CERRI|nr:hypothetical protein KP509_09G011000 [Ceratopteris richardii]
MFEACGSLLCTICDRQWSKGKHSSFMAENGLRVNPSARQQTTLSSTPCRAVKSLHQHGHLLRPTPSGRQPSHCCLFNQIKGA